MPRRKPEHPPDGPGRGPLGDHHERPDARAKVSGGTRYVGDLAVPGMLHAAVAVAPVASARVGRLDLAVARAVDGVEAVITAAGIPGKNLVGVIFEDQPLLALERVRMVGERLALVAARTPEAAWAAARLVQADLEPLPAVHDPVQALAPDAPHVHDAGNLIRTFRVVRGDTARARAGVVVEAEYRVGGQEHAYLEPQGCLAIPEGRQRITIVASCQCPFYVQQAVAKVLGLPLAAVRVEQAPTGGGFGGKEDYPSEPAACAAVLAFATGRAVRFVLPRELDMQASSKRHPMVIRHRWGADRNGRLRFAEVETVLDAGAYIGISTVVAERANVSSIGPYHVPAVRVTTRVAYTNNLFGGAFRGFGAPQVTWAAEATIDRLARACALDPLEFRRRNLLDDRRRRICTGQLLPRPVLARECLERAAALAGWDEFQLAPARGPEKGTDARGDGDRPRALRRQPAPRRPAPRSLVGGGDPPARRFRRRARRPHRDGPGEPRRVPDDRGPGARGRPGSGAGVAARHHHGRRLGPDGGLARRARLRDGDPRRGHPPSEEVGSRRRRVARLRRRGGRARRRSFALGCGSDPARCVPIPAARRRGRHAPHRGDRRRAGTGAGHGASTPPPEPGTLYEFYAVACHVARVAVDVELLGTVRATRTSRRRTTSAASSTATRSRDRSRAGSSRGSGGAPRRRSPSKRGRLTNPSFTERPADPDLGRRPEDLDRGRRKRRARAVRWAPRGSASRR